MFRSATIFREFTMSSLKSHYSDHIWMYANRGDVEACRVVCIGLYLKSVRVYVF